MRKQEEHSTQLIRALTSILAGSVIAFGVSLAVLAAAAAAISAGKLPYSAAEQISVAASVAACIVGGLYAVLCCRSRVLPVGLSVGGLYFLIWMTAGMIAYGSISLESGLKFLAAGLCGGAAAGLLCSGRKKRRK